MKTRYLRFVAGTAIAVCLLASNTGLAQRGGPPRVNSPELTANGDVILRLRAPSATEVRLTSGGDIPGVPSGGLDLEPDADGVWEVTLPALASGAYRYNFNVDGVSTLDPANPGISQSNGNAWSLFYVSGSGFMDTQDVPHGAVAEVTYYSEEVGGHRRMHVYTPAGYQLDDATYPVFYLLHGAGDSDDSWSTVGRAGFILDNLIASGDAERMIVVMPAGHSRGNAEFTREFARDIKPYVEANYRVRTGRDDTAIAGLSMGGAQTLDIAMGNLNAYGYLGVFSSGVFGIADDTSWQEANQAALDDRASRDGLKLIWFSTGSDDFLLDTTEATVAMLREHDFDVIYEESTGGHTWINWRRYLNRFAPLLFQ